jgi:hypothetical protein
LGADLVNVEIFEPGQVWRHTWDENVTYYLILESLDVSKFRWTGSVPEPGFSILRLDDGQMTYVCCSSLYPDEDLWRRIA